MTAEQSDDAGERRQVSFSAAEESARLAALRSYCVLDTGREARFDDLTGLAADICETPVSLVSLVDSHRLFFKSAHGIDVREVPYPDFFCGHAIRQREVFVVPDALEDPRFAKHALVVDPPRARSYAGVPLVTPQDHVLGTLCVIDFVPRKFDPKQIGTLRILARQVMWQLDLNLQAMRDPLTGLYNRRRTRQLRARGGRRMPLGRRGIRDHPSGSGKNRPALARRDGAQKDRAGADSGGGWNAQSHRFHRPRELSLLRRHREERAARRGRGALQGQGSGAKQGCHVYT